jgi:hypothetical protein
MLIVHCSWHQKCKTMNVNCTLFLKQKMQTKATNWALLKFTTNEYFCNKKNKHSPTSKHWRYLTHIQTLQDLELRLDYALLFSRYISSFHNFPLQVVNKIWEFLMMPLKILTCNVPSSHYRISKFPWSFSLTICLLTSTNIDHQHPICNA